MKRLIAGVITTMIAVAGTTTAFASSASGHINASSKITKKTERIVIKPRPLMTKSISNDDKYLVRVYKSAPAQGRVIKPATTKRTMPNLYLPVTRK